MVVMGGPEGIDSRRSSGTAELLSSSSADDSPTQRVSITFWKRCFLQTSLINTFVAPLAAQTTTNTCSAKSFWFLRVEYDFFFQQTNWKHFQASLFTGCGLITLILIPNDQSLELS